MRRGSLIHRTLLLAALIAFGARGLAWAPAAWGDQSSTVRSALQAPLNALASDEARHDYAGWRKLAASLFASNAVIVSRGALGTSSQTFQQFLAAEQRNLIAMADSTGAVEHDYVQNVTITDSQHASAVSELTMHLHEMVEQKPAVVDAVVRREYALQQTGGVWRITRLIVTPVSLSVNGKFLGLSRPQRQTRKP